MVIDMVIDARAPDLAAPAADSRVADIDLVHTAPVQLAGDSAAVDGLAIESLKGALPVEVVSGRVPFGLGRDRRRPALGPAARADRGRAGRGGRAGRAGAADRDGGSSSCGARSAPRSAARCSWCRQLASLALNTPILDANVQAVPGHVDALFGELSSRLEVYRPEVPDEVRNLGDLRLLPELLAVVPALGSEPAQPLTRSPSSLSKNELSLVGTAFALRIITPVRLPKIVLPARSKGPSLST
jgi:hypothetical protein